MPKTTPPGAPDANEPASYLDMPAERRVAAKKHAAILSETMQRLAADIAFTADVDDFRRVLTAEVKS